MEQEFFASCLSGLERALADELKSLGIERVRPLGGGVAFFCEAEQALRACLWSRLASRVMLVVGRVNAADAELLYAGVYDLHWETILAVDATIAVRAHGSNAELRNTRFTALKAKDAIADRLRLRRGSRPDVDVRAPRASIDIRIRAQRATVSLDFSGESLSRRAYLGDDDKEDSALACSKAAGALALSGWGERARKGDAFVDPACRDGILLVEAASIACDRASGLGRKRWGFFGWAHYDESVWKSLEDEARDRFDAGIVRVAGAEALRADRSAPPDLGCVRFAGVSNSSPMVSRARNHVRRAGLRQVVSVEIGDASSVGDLLARVLEAGRKGRACDVSVTVAADIDAHARMGSPASVQADEAAFVAASAAASDGCRSVVIGANDVATRFGFEPMMSFTVGQGRIESTVEIFDGVPRGGRIIEVPDLAGGAPHRVEVLEPGSDQFAARLRKVFKERRKWAVREGVSCYRLYDSDLPDYAVAIDWYTGSGHARGNNYLHIAEYAAPSSVDPDKARRRFADVLAIAPIVCGVRPDHVFSKRRVREKGGSQYRNEGAKAYPTTVEEGGYLFEVDLAGRIDTGLFLDHRVTRMLIGQAAKGKRFLNLFAYTGTASVYAAGAGAQATTTVDLSQTYLDWARRNMQANGFSGKAHQFVRADVLRWITEMRRTATRFDLIFVDPPTFSNSKAMGKKTWDVQRDHVELLIGVTHLLAERGEAIFSCNQRTFKPDYERLSRYGVELEDISLETIPQDFSRTPKIHKCYRVRHAAAVSRGLMGEKSVEYLAGVQGFEPR